MGLHYWGDEPTDPMAPDPDDMEWDDDDEYDVDLEYFEDDGQPTEYEERQDYYGGDDCDHGQYDDGEYF